ncbi:MAG: hypothetical protein ACOYON_04520 [Fimbriimonas sp.]
MKTQSLGRPQITWSGLAGLLGRVINVRGRRVQGAASPPALATPQERQAELARFYERYEDLVDVLCDAAQYGPNPSLEGRYTALRAWVHRAYAEVQPFVACYLREAGTPDPFLALAQEDSLSDALLKDDGHLILRITQTREALTLYAEHLRQLSARAA